MRVSFELLGFLVSPVACQLNYGTPGSEGNDNYSGSRLCNRTFAEANSTGVVSFYPNLGHPEPVSWATTVYQTPSETTQNATTELSLWLSTNGLNYTDSNNLGYDMCYFWIKGLTLNSISFGQSDSGNCLSTLGQQCSSDLVTLTTTWAETLDEGQSRTENGSSGSVLPKVCSDLAGSLTEHFPSSCKAFFNNSTRVVTGAPPQLGGPLTGSSSLVDRARCQMNSSYHLMWTQFGEPDTITYYLANWWMTPLITAFMPVADPNRTITLGVTKAVLSCVRSDTLNNGSAPVPPFDTATASASGGLGNSSNTTSSDTTSDQSLYSQKKSLSAGAIAGIVIGSVLGSLITIGLMIVCIRRRRSGGQNEKPATTTDTPTRPAEMDETVQVSELGAPMGQKGSMASEMEAPTY